MCGLEDVVAYVSGAAAIAGVNFRSAVQDKRAGEASL